MPHDVNGKELRPGDRVLVECVITSVQANDEYCNVNLQTLHPMYPTKQPSMFVLNARQVRLPPRDLNHARPGDIVRIQQGVTAVDVSGKWVMEGTLPVGGARAEVIATGSCVTDLRLLDAVGSLRAGTMVGINSHGLTGGGHFDLIERPGTANK